MKKKITAAALALCLVLGLLPMSVLAARYTGTLNGEEITIDVDDTTGAVTLPEDLAAHYSVAPEKLTVGSFQKTQEFTLTEHYGDAPGTIKITGTLVETEGDTVETVTPEVDAEGNATVEAKDVNITENTETVILDLSSKDDAAVTIKSDLVTAVAASNVQHVEVQTSIAVAEVPVEVLKNAAGDTKVEVKQEAAPESKLPADTDAVVRKSVAGAKAVTVTVTVNGQSLLPKKTSYAAADPAISIAIKGLKSGSTYVVLCISDGALSSFGRFEKIAGTMIDFKSRHLSDFIAVEETTENAAALAAVTADPGNADAVTPPATTVKVESVKTDIAQFTKVQVSGLDKNKVYLIAVGKVGSTQSNSVISGVDTHEFYCNTQGGKQTISVYEFASKDALGAAKDITDNLKVRTEVAKVTE